MSEQMENIRRMAERGLRRAQQPPMSSAFIDMFQHILDEYGRAKLEQNKDIQVLSKSLLIAIRIIEENTNTNDYSNFRGKCKELANKYKDTKEDV